LDIIYAYLKYFSGLPWIDPELSLKTWSDENLNISFAVSVPFRNSKSTESVMLPLMIMTDNGPTIMGRQWFTTVRVSVNPLGTEVHCHS
jgi:hypothetical protein